MPTKTLDQLLADYMALHWLSIDDDAKAHLKKFVAFVEPDQAPAPGSDRDPAVVARTETKVYTDGTSVTGPGPLPEQSPGGAPVMHEA